MKLWAKFQNWYYSTAIGGKHLEFLLWLDRQKSTRDYYLTPGEVQQIVRQYSLLDQGVKEMKSKVNTIVRSKSKEEYHQVLKEIENLIELAQRDENSPEAKFADILRKTSTKTVDVQTATDRAKMIDTKIKAVYELQDHVVKRNKLREIRKLRTAGKNEEADKLMKEWQDQYGRQSKRP